MLILTLRTDKPDAEIGLFEDKLQLGYTIWQAHRQLAETIQQKIEALLNEHGKMLHDLAAVVVYKGPGSFTGLRIGISVANALAYGLQIPIVGAQTDTWAQVGITRLLKAENDQTVLPDYGAEPHITTQKK